MKPGSVALVGTGPGHPGLVTLRALDLVRQADAIVYDYLGASDLIHQAPPKAEKIYVGKKAAQHTLPQEAINDLLVQLARQGKRVVRLKGGDPFVFGRGGEEAEVLAAADIPFEIVPGVTSGIAAPAFAGIPVTHRDATSCLTLLTGHEDPSKPSSSLNWRALVESRATLVIYMGVERLEAICQRLSEAGLPADCPVALVQWGTLPRQRTVSGTLATIAARVRQAGLQAPAIIVVGTVAAKRQTLRWFDTRPLFGRRIVVTRTRTQAGRLADLLAEAGADVLELPTLRITPNPWLPGQWKQPQPPDWIAFTSPNAVQIFLQGLWHEGLDSRALAGTKLAAVGSGTARELQPFGLRHDFTPTTATGEHLAQQLPASPGQRILWPCGNLASTAPLDILQARGLNPRRMEIYRTEPDPEATALAQSCLGTHPADWIIFTSASSAENLHAMGIPLPTSIRVATLGPITTAAVQRLGWPVAAQAPEASLDALVATLIEKEAENANR